MNLLITRRGLGSMAVAGLAAAAGISTARAFGPATPADKPILKITGKISVSNSQNIAMFDRDMLEALGLVSLTTTTPWYDGPVTFEGIRLDRLMQSVGASGTTVTVYALNDFTTNIPLDDFGRFKPILALKRDGRYMSVRDKGPLFIVYPYDSDPHLKSQTFYSRSAWQVARMDVS